MLFFKLHGDMQQKVIFQLYRDKKGMSKWVVVVELQISNFSAISWREHDSVGWNDCFSEHL
jgi:hypothetical protein